APRYFPPGSVGPAPDLGRLLRWIDELRRVARDADHPWSADLAVESLVAQGREALQTPRPAPRRRGGASLHSSP
ncbi:MAG: DNA polymerase III subunit delta', partial [Pseudomonadota bacterium]|nr:DNA polymerase III subunit delta' [Pseudomonadota bacterium]